MAKIPLTVVVLAKNEEAVIGACCESIFGWADEIIVVDDNSCDHTIDVVKRYTSRVYTQTMLNEGRHRNWAYALAQYDWVEPGCG
ncbi:MAG TPA: glycosyltransferase [Candidatus Omnitrophota bacterium]|nr:glycosyltransferase [Candidatus Omnitrophota bacterium]